MLISFTNGLTYEDKKIIVDHDYTLVATKKATKDLASRGFIFTVVQTLTTALDKIMSIICQKVRNREGERSTEEVPRLG